VVAVDKKSYNLSIKWNQAVRIAFWEMGKAHWFSACENRLREIPRPEICVFKLEMYCE
jgi:hypothetical protein